MSGSGSSSPHSEATDQPRACDVCGSDRAWFGFDLHKGKVWFCAVHRETGEALFRPVARTRKPARD